MDNSGSGNDKPVATGGVVDGNYLFKADTSFWLPGDHPFVQEAKQRNAIIMKANCYSLVIPVVKENRND